MLVFLSRVARYAHLVPSRETSNTFCTTGMRRLPCTGMSVTDTASLSSVMRVNRMPPSSETLVTELSTSGVLLQPASANATAARQNASFLLIAALPEFPKPQMLRPDRAARKSNLAGADRSWRICWEKRNTHGLSLTAPTAANKWGQTPLSPARDRAQFRSWPRIQVAFAGTTSSDFPLISRFPDPSCSCYKKGRGGTPWQIR